MIKKVILALLCSLVFTTGASAQTYIRLWPNGNDGNIALLNQSVTVANAREQGTVGIQVTNTFVGTLVPQCTVDGTNWQAIRVTPTNSTTTVASMTGTGLWTGPIAGCKSVRVTATAWSSGTATVTINTFAGGGGSGTGGGSGGGGGGDITINGSAPDTNSGNTSAQTIRTVESTDSQLSAEISLIRAAAESSASSLDSIHTNLNPDAVHDNLVTATGPQIICEAKDFDGSALPNVVSVEGKSARVACSRYGVSYVMLMNSDGSTSLGTTTTPMIISGPIAHDAADSGNPVKIGTRSQTTLSSVTLVSNNDRSDVYSDLDGAVLARLYGTIGDKVNGTVGITDGSSTSVVAAQGAGIRFCATTIVVSNSSATGVTVDIRDGTAGTVLMTIPAAPSWGGASVTLPAPLCTTANTIFAADPSASATTVNVTAVGFKTKL